MNIPFNIPYVTGEELSNIGEAIHLRKFSGNNSFTKKCQAFFEKVYGFKKSFLTNSCTDALEMSALLLNIQQGDEVIMPSYTFVSTANAFVLRGAKIVFVDSEDNTPNIDSSKIRKLITGKTKAIVVVHYAGVSCDMDTILSIAEEYNLYVVEDAAQAIDSLYNGKPLGSLGDIGAFSFHETKNIICGEGGLITLNKEKYIDRAEILWEKGTNRSAFFRGEIDKYGWVDIGSSYLPSELNAAFLYSQLNNIDRIQKMRVHLWHTYHKGLSSLEDRGHIVLPFIPEYATVNGHLFYFVCKSLKVRTALLKYLKSVGIHAVFHYQSLHLSPYFRDKHDGRDLPNCDKYTNRLVRLPMFYELKYREQLSIIEAVYGFFK